MQEKYKNRLHFLIAKLYRDFLRHRVSKLISWRDTILQPGCSVVIGMCSRIPDILIINLRYLEGNIWEDLKEVLIVVDNEDGCLPHNFEQKILTRFHKLNIRFLYYTPQQALFAERYPICYAWLSWCIGFNEANTQTAFIHDYDALLIDNTLKERYQKFVNSSLKIQGVSIFGGSGNIAFEDNLVRTWETFIDLEWIKSFPPVKLFYRLGLLKTRWVDYDILLDIQANNMSVDQRAIVPFSFDELVHPSQMIRQYTRFRKSPGKRLPCSTIIALPFFYFLSGRTEALSQATQALKYQPMNSVDLIGDGTLINLSLLNTPSVEFVLKLMLRVFINLNIKPFKDFFDYSNMLYSVSRTSRENLWKGDFTQEQYTWLKIGIME